MIYILLYSNVFSIDLLPTVKRMIHPIATTNSLCNISTSQVQCPEAILSVLVYHPIKVIKSMCSGIYYYIM